MLATILDRQYRRPTGLLGRYIGRQMAHDHRPENRWTVEMLQAQSTEHILELGFGAGIAIQALTPIVKTGSISGIDFSPTMVRAASQCNALAIRRGQVRLVCGNAAALPFQANTFDQAFSIHSIYFWPQPLAALRGIWRVLKPGGRLVLTILPKALWNIDNPDLAVGTAECRPFGGDELCAMLQAAGFSATSIKADPNPTYRSNYSVIGVKEA